MKLGMVGLPNVGKSTVFNALTNAGAESANYPFCTIEPNVGIVSVPDPRLDWLAKLHSPDKFTPATLEFVDIAGLVRGASKGEGLGNKFLGNIREVDALIHVVRCFENGDIVHVDGKIDPISDIETIEYELILSDIELVDRRIDKARKASKGDKKYAAEAELLTELKTYMEAGNPARGWAELEQISDLPLLSGKPVIYAANLGDGESAGNVHSAAVEKRAALEGSRVVPICAKIEEEIAQLDDEDKAMFLSDAGLEESGLSRIIREGYKLLGLISFLTAGKPEVRAWTIRDGTRAPQAAGKIHTDFERGFIRAEIVAFDDLQACGTMTVAKEKGLVRLEGKDYVMKDGDITLFRFNV